MDAELASMFLSRNPFDPVGSGVPPQGPTWLPESWKILLREALSRLGQAGGAKALAIAAEYGGGKTYALEWLLRVELPERGILPYYFSSPGVRFYDLANAWLRQIGRKEFAKSLWELARVHARQPQRSLIGTGESFEEYLRTFPRDKAQVQVLDDLQEALRKAGVAKDEEIAHRLARIAAGTPSKPYFEYRDFVGGTANSLVAEREEAPYFKAILSVLLRARNGAGVALLLDEFEEISLEKQLSSREKHDYLSTLRRLIDLAKDQDLWVIAALHPNAVAATSSLEPSLWQRFTGDGVNALALPPFREEDAEGMIAHRLTAARPQGANPPSPLFPFPDDLATILTPRVFSSPRRLVQVCFFAISTAGASELPFSADHLLASARVVLGGDGL